MKLVRTGRRSGENKNENLSSKTLVVHKATKNRSFHVKESTRTSAECRQGRNALAKGAKVLFFIVKYANHKHSCFLRLVFFVVVLSVEK